MRELTDVNKIRKENNSPYSENGKEGRESYVKAAKKREKDELVGQEKDNNLENDNNLEKFDLEENMGVLAAQGSQVVSSRLDCGSVHGKVCV